MIKQNLFIINIDILYEILDEIKENLSFDIIKHENEANFIQDKNFDKKNSLVIIKSNNKLDIDDKNILNILDYPLPVLSLIELINIHLIKIRFNYQSKVNIKDYELNLNSKTFSKADLNLKLTEKEIEIILYLIKNEKKNSVLDLQKNIWGYAADMETHTVETHIYRLRKKISDKFNDNSFILSHPDGYFINKTVVNLV
jgi:DNA-binding winged helix-turn-helix (wHTH) protein